MPRYVSLVLLIASLVAWAVPAEGGAVRDKIAVKAARIIPVKGDEIENGTVLVSNGRIEAVGADLEIPYDYWVVDAAGLVVFPGMVEACTTRGLDRANESLPVMPFLDVYDAIDPSSVYFEEALRDGTTTLLIAQGPDTVIGGVARAVRPIGMTVDEMTVLPEAGIVLSFAPKSGFDRMVQMATFRETFRELQEYLDDQAEARFESQCKEEGKDVTVGPKEAAEQGRSLLREEDLDFKHRNLYRLVHGKLRAFLYCEKPVDVLHALDTAKEHGFLDQSVLVLGNECYKAAERIKESGRPVILDADMVYKETDPLTGKETEVFVPKIFHDAGVPFAIRSNPSASFGERYLWYQADRLIRNGIPRPAAIEAITSAPAGMIGLGGRVGVIAPGAEANLLILSGDPLAADTWVNKVILSGCVVYEREKDRRLKELLTGEEQKPPTPEDVTPEEAPDGKGQDASAEEGDASKPAPADSGKE